MLPWRNSWFQIAFFAWIVSGALLFVDFAPKISIDSGWTQAFQRAPRQPSEAPAKPLPPSEQQSPAKESAPARQPPSPASEKPVLPTEDKSATKGLTPVRPAPGPSPEKSAVLGGVVPIYNIAGINKPMNFSGDVIADIYLGKIAKWNDPRIATDNPGVSLPDKLIIPVYRSDGSGATYIFTDYLSKVSPDWANKVGKNTSVKWPAGIGMKGNEGVSGWVQHAPGAFGYIELTYAMQNKIAFGAVKNTAGSPASEKPTTKTPNTSGMKAGSAELAQGNAANDRKDYAQAMQWYQKAAAQGNAEAELMIGLLHFWGHGVPDDSAEGIRWFKKSAVHGNAQADMWMGECYARGMGVQKDYLKAIKWYEKEEAHSDASDDAEDRIAILFALGGPGVSQDNAEAIRWYQKAAAQGDDLAKQEITNLQAAQKSK